VSVTEPVMVNVFFDAGFARNSRFDMAHSAFLSTRENPRHM
jgi:hypothetical protein